MAVYREKWEDNLLRGYQRMMEMGERAQMATALLWTRRAGGRGGGGGGTIEVVYNKEAGDGELGERECQMGDKEEVLRTGEEENGGEGGEQQDEDDGERGTIEQRGEDMEG